MGWTLDDIDWQAFDPAAVEPAILRLVKAAALVEANADDYVAYLTRVFTGDDGFAAAARHWGEEEKQHGLALGRWAELAEPGFDFAAALQCFRDSYQVPAEATASVRGSHAGELISRCIVECGTSSLYSAIRDHTGEPVLKQICQRIAGDEFRHYQLFRRYLQAYPRLPAWRRIAVAAGRVLEAGDDELASAWYAANVVDRPYDRKQCARSYERHATRLYRHHHVGRMVNMMLKAIEVNPQGRTGRLVDRVAWFALSRRAGQPG